MKCEEWRRVRDPQCRERCGRQAVGYVVSGPMFVCHIHARHHEVNGEEIARVSPPIGALKSGGTP